MMEKINKLSLPATILIASIVLGGFYFLSQVVKQNSIERQQQTELSAEAHAEQKERDRQALDQLSKMSCVEEAQESAIEQYKDTCTFDCQEGYFYTANYDSYYDRCLQRKGLK